MKRFLRTLFWRNNPKAGMLFSILLGAILATVLFPLGLYAYCTFPLFVEYIEKTGHTLGMLSMVMESYRLFGFVTPYSVEVITNSVIQFIPFFPLVFLLFYMFVLAWLYSAHVVRSSFHCNKFWAGLVALLFAQPLLLLVCAVKMKNSRALLAFAICAVMVVSSLIVNLLPEFPLHVHTIQLLVLAITGAYIMAVAALPEKQRRPRWTYAPLWIYLASVVFLSVVAAWLECRADRLDEEVVRFSGVKWTMEEADALFTNGIPISAEPYATLLLADFSDTTLKARNKRTLHGNFSQEDFEQYMEFVESNAEMLALLDEATDVLDFHPAHENPPEFMESATYFYGMTSSILDWTRFYRRKLGAAAYQGDVATVMDCLRKMRTLRSWAAESPAHVDVFLENAIFSMFYNDIAMTLPQLPDEALTEFASEIKIQLDGVEQTLRFAFMNDRLMMYRGFDWVEKTLVGKTRKSRFIIGFPQLLAIWRNCERFAILEELREVFTIINCGERSYYKFSERIYYYEHHLPLAKSLTDNWSHSLQIHALLQEKHHIVLAGIAVERYRRAHGTLPASLDVLVPEFLDCIQSSVINGEPLMYRTGEFEVLKGWETIFTNQGYQVYGPVYRKLTGVYEHFTVSLEANPSERVTTEIFEQE